MDDVLNAADGQASNVIALPRPGETHETPALKQAARAADARDAVMPDKTDLLRRIEARRVEFEISHADIGLLALNALGKQVVSLKSLSVASLEALLDLLDNGVTWTEPVEIGTAHENPAVAEAGGAFMAACKKLYLEEER